LHPGRDEQLVGIEREDVVEHPGRARVAGEGIFDGESIVVEGQ
jgi:hypothetical protein